MKQEIVQRLRALEDKYGRLTPEILVRDARNPKSPLHDQFDWDVKRAAMAHWLEQARAIIRSVTVIVHEDRCIVRSPVYVRDPAQALSDQGYISVVKLRDDPESARDAVLAEFARAASALRRAHAVASALNLANEVTELYERVEKLREELENRDLH
jgi:hypothetical protein